MTTAQDLIDKVDGIGMKKIEFLENVKHKGQEHQAGDIITHEDGQYFQDLGWAKCAETGETGERKEGVSKIKPNNVVGTQGIVA